MPAIQLTAILIQDFDKKIQLFFCRPGLCFRYYGQINAGVVLYRKESSLQSGITFFFDCVRIFLSFCNPVNAVFCCDRGFVRVFYFDGDAFCIFSICGTDVNGSVEGFRCTYRYSNLKAAGSRLQAFILACNLCLESSGQVYFCIFRERKRSVDSYFVGIVFSFTDLHCLIVAGPGDLAVAAVRF